MTATPDSAKADSLQTRTNDCYPCRYRAFLRLCHAERKTPKVVYDEARIATQDRTKLRTWQPVRPIIYDKLAAVLDCEPTSLYHIPERPLPHEIPTRAFAHRVEELIDNGTIPRKCPDTGKPTDVVEFVWQLGDPVLNGISLTHQQERDAYLLLRDEYQRLIERPIHTGTRRNQLGKFQIAVTWKEDIIADIQVRRALAQVAYDVLEQQYKVGTLSHIERIKEELPARFQHYKDVVEDDKKYDTNEYANVVPTDFRDFLPKDKKDHIDPRKLMKYFCDAFRHLLSERMISLVIDADFYCRKIIFPTYQQDMIFHQCYSRSRALINFMVQKRPDHFPNWWVDFRDENTNDLQEFCDAWSSDPLNWGKMWDATNRTLDRTIREIDEYYPSMEDIDDRTNNSVDGR